MSRVDRELTLIDIVAQIRERVDLILTEGFVRESAAKIEVSRAARRGTLIAPPDELLAVASDQTFDDLIVTRFGLDDFAAIADLIEGHAADHRRLRGQRSHDGPR